nr:PREDICTED: uncharacterized protein LOC106706435 [Latimeria chalumnae]XP_014352884.1 PREDICTED: uncharacterized protein LOC106706435 [Latimeria chalumnae]XP_014352885.1 PREDICTED: uncharacterized protein LOC106706435 [Latimeria chalumnae]XP_014352886.1 PREDICTED: uncharacterized protein LOC106706435 [Latimeria chalumnae]XP_014352887.1 PREDICTED: uncharacterized protein LOC106706435 [Latimeria chalumnae]|eukprot:XP_014352883.1 PREDICTED: uncharacterized protein LOC106706435 [Latimeria chalumnae]
MQLQDPAAVRKLRFLPQLLAVAMCCQELQACQCWMSHRVMLSQARPLFAAGQKWRLDRNHPSLPITFQTVPVSLTTTASEECSPKKDLCHDRLGLQAYKGIKNGEKTSSKCLASNTEITSFKHVMLEEPSLVAHRSLADVYPESHRESSCCHTGLPGSSSTSQENSSFVEIKELQDDLNQILNGLREVDLSANLELVTGDYSEMSGATSELLRTPSPYVVDSDLEMENRGKIKFCSPSPQQQGVISSSHSFSDSYQQQSEKNYPLMDNEVPLKSTDMTGDGLGLLPENESLEKSYCLYGPQCSMGCEEV